MIWRHKYCSNLLKNPSIICQFSMDIKLKPSWTRSGHEEKLSGIIHNHRCASNWQIFEIWRKFVLNYLGVYRIVSQNILSQTTRCFGKFRKDFKRTKQKSDQVSPPSGPYFDTCRCIHKNVDVDAWVTNI